MTEKHIYVLLLDEGIDVWRPVRAIEVRPATFKIIELESPEVGETWQFHEGQEVVVQARHLNGDEVLVAVAALQESESC
jgi:hypothetical protein